MIPEELRYHKEHEWIRVENNTAVLGITHYAQDSLGDVVYLEAPIVGHEIKIGQEIGEVESTKTTSPIYSPVDGTIIETNAALREQPELINKDPYHEGWIAKIRLSHPDVVEKLMSAKEYSEYLKKLGE